MSEQYRQSKPSWKGDGQGGRKDDARPGWRKEASPAEPTAVLRTWKAKASLALSGFVVLSAGLAYLIYIIFPPKVPRLVAVGAPYYANLSVGHNAYGWQGLRDLGGWCMGDPQASSWWGATRPAVSQAEPQEVSTDEDWDKGLAKSFRQPTVVVYFSLHGGSDPQGAYLLRRSGTEKIYLKDILDRLAKLDAKKNKILILDAVHDTANPALGMVHNDFVRQLKKLDDQIAAIPNLIVLTASGEDERSWASEEWRQTIFTHFVLEGLKGAAAKGGNARVTAAELFEYARRQVGAWVSANRNQSQTPQLLPSKDGLARAGGMIVSVVTEAYQEPSPAGAPGGGFKIPDELTAAWKECDDLRKGVPAPEVYSPHLWREYRDTLLRLEQLYRARQGSDVDEKLRESIAALEGRRENLKRDMEKAATLEGVKAAGRLALPMPRILAGKSAAAGKLQSLENDLKLLANAPEMEQPDDWGKIKEKARKLGVSEALAPWAAGWVVNRLVDSEKKGNEFFDGLKNAAGLVGLITDHGNDRPTEVHYLDMLVRDLTQDPRPPAEDVRAALDLHARAERIALSAESIPGDSTAFHPYAEQVYPWIKELVRQADEDRRLGEDLLFSTQKEDWAKARKFRAAADQNYGTALRYSALLRRGFRLRDRLFAELPDYSRWVVRRAAIRDVSGWDKQAQAVTTLWEGAHYLAGRLKAPPAPDQNFEAFFKELEVKLGGLQRTFEELEGGFKSHCQELGGPKDDKSQKPLQEIEAALAGPLYDVTGRERLLTKSRSISGTLSEQFGQPADREAGKVDGDQQARAARNVAALEGQLALVALGKDWFDQSKNGVDREPYDDVGALLKARDDAAWSKLARAGEQIGFRWRAMALAIGQAVAPERNAPLAKVRERLASAEALCRQLPAAAGDDLGPNPVLDLRRLRTHSLLVGQAHRAYGDHWWAFDKTNRPYYEEAVQAYLGDAKTLATPPRDRQKEKEAWWADVTQAEAALTPSRLDLGGSKELPLTSEIKFNVPYQVEAGKGLPLGFVTLWVEPPPGFGLADKAKWEKKRRAEEIGAGEPKPGYVLEPPVLRDVPPKADPKVTKLIGRYRGQKLERQTRIAMQLQPNVIIYEPAAPRRAALGIRTDKSLSQQFSGENSALTIILDCSGSMRSIDPKDPQKRSRFKKAVDVLEEVMPGIAKGTSVSLWVFAAYQPMPGNVEDTIRPLERHLRWDPDNRQQLKTLIEKVRELRPYFETPLVRAMVDAQADLKPGPGEKIEGHRVMLVLTDGMDTRFEAHDYRKEFGVDAEPSTGDPKYNDGGGVTKIAKFLPEKFQDSGIEIKIVGFELDDKEKVLAEKQFKEPIGKLQPPGEFFTTDNLAVLKEKLRQALHPRLRCQLLYDNGLPVPGIEKQGMEVPESDTTFALFGGQTLEKGTYKMVLPRVGEQTLQLDDGDTLLVNLTRRGLVRALYARDEMTKNKPTKEAGGQGRKWILGVLQNKYTAGTAVEMLVTLEEVVPAAPTGLLKQVKPDAVYFTLKAKGTDRPLAVNWEPVFNQYPAPTWKLEVKDWPSDAGKPAEAVLGVHWLHGVGLPKLAEPSLGDLARRKSISARGIDLEFQDPAVQPNYPSGKDKKPQSSSLVVRLRHPPGKPVLMNLRGISGLSGAEHRYYQATNQYTAVFWPVTEDQVKRDPELLRLEIIPWEEVEKLAREKGTSLSLELNAPTLGDRPPSPIWAGGGKPAASGRE